MKAGLAALVLSTFGGSLVAQQIPLAKRPFNEFVPHPSLRRIAADALRALSARRARRVARLDGGAAVDGRAQAVAPARTFPAH